MKNYFCVRLKELRLQNNLTQKQLAKLSGCSVYKIRKWENCITYPKLFDAVALCCCLNVELDYLRDNSSIKEIQNFNCELDDNLRYITLE